MTTAVLWMRGILQHEYGVPLNQIEWVAELDDDVDVNAAARHQISRCCRTTNRSRPCWPRASSTRCSIPISIKPFVAKDPRVARLFPDHKAEEIAYYQRTGIFPIMHVHRPSPGAGGRASVARRQSVPRLQRGEGRSP